MQSTTEPLLTLQREPDSEQTTVPDCRMTDAATTQDFVRRLIDNDSSKRSWKRARVNGLVDGNPPYVRSKLLAANRADACNVNWGTARAYMEAGAGALYDLTSEAPGIFAIRTSFGGEKQDEYSNIMSQEADQIAHDDPTWDYNMQQSQWNIILHGVGPYVFEDAYQVFPKALQAGDLKVPEFTRSDTAYWDAATLLNWYYPPQVYEFIRSPEAAKAMGWDVPYTRLVISAATNIRMQNGKMYDWEFYQQQMKNNSLSYYDDTKVVYLAHVFWKEFSGRITHAIVMQNTTYSEVPIKYLFLKVGRYETWQNCVHPMYFDRGNGGYHHSVTGLGVKMYSAMDYQNRLLCNLADKAFAPKILFKPTTTEASQKFSMQNFGDFAVLNSNWDWQQTGVAGLMQEGLAMNQGITDLMQSNLSSYRQQMPMKQQGNPITAKQVMYDATQQATLTKTSYNRFYKQEDQLCTEIVRRLCNLNTTDRQAQEYQERCRKRGLPDECFGRIERVEAVRVIGQGSAFMRKQAVDALLPLIASLPEKGRDNLLADKIAAEAGTTAVKRYYPTQVTKFGSMQEERATNQVAGMKVGVAPIIEQNQNPVTFAAIFLQAAEAAVQSLTQGGSPLEVLQFIEMVGPAILAHLRRFANDPTREAIFKELFQKHQELAKLTDGLRQQVAQIQEAQKNQRDAAAAVADDNNLKQLKATSDIALKTAKTQAQLKQSQEKHSQKMAQGAQSMVLKDAETAAKIQREKAAAAAAAKKKPSAGAED